MITIIVNGAQLEMPRTSSVGAEILHPAFQDNILGGGYTFPIDFPNTPSNAIALQMPHDLSNYEPIYKFEVTAEYKGINFGKCKLIIDRPSTKSFGGYLQLGIRALRNITSKLKELAVWPQHFYLGFESKIVSDNCAMITKTEDFETYGICFPIIKNSKFYDPEINPDYGGYLNMWDYNSQKFFVNKLGAPGEKININALSPCMYLFYALKMIFKDAGYSFDCSKYLDAYNKKRFIAFNSNYALDKLSAPQFGASVYQGGQIVYNNFSYPFQQTLHLNLENYDTNNCFDTGTYEYTVQQEGRLHIRFNGQINRLTVTADGRKRFIGFKVYLDTLLLGEHGNWWDVSFSTLDWTFDITPTLLLSDVGKKIRIIVSCHDNRYGHEVQGEQCQVMYANALFESLDNNVVNVYASHLDYRNLLPDMTVQEFLEGARDLLNCSFIADPFTNTVVLYSNELEATSISGDITEISSPNWEGTKVDELVKSIAYDFQGDDSLLENMDKTYDESLSLGDMAMGTEPNASTTVLGTTYVASHTHERFICVFDEALNGNKWILLKHDYEPMIIDSTYDTEFLISFSPMFTTMYSDFYNGVFPVLWIECEGYTPGYNSANNPLSSVRWFTYMPPAESIGGTFYPLGTNSWIYKDPLFSYDARFKPGDVFYWQMFRRWMNYRNAPMLWEENISITHGDLNNFILDPLKSIYYTKMLDGKKILINRLTFSIGNEIDAHIEFVIPSPNV
jgi:hypothetical protein